MRNASLRISPCRPAPSSRLPRSPLRNRGSCPSTVRATDRPATPEPTSSSRSSRSRRNQGRASSGFSASGGSSISPVSRAAVQPSAALTIAGTSLTGAPMLRLLQRQIDLDQHVDRPARLARRLVDLLQQVDAVDGVNGADRRRGFSALFDCRWPMRCHRSLVSADCAIFCRASWTLFSPKSSCPASAAARTASMGWVLETAISRTSSGRRPARPAAFAIRSRTSRQPFRNVFVHWILGPRPASP